jgi:NADH dehydrogenase [ubiquinone] 1 alpha subcomplex assembly factor 7
VIAANRPPPEPAMTSAPLLDHLIRSIRITGPLTVADFMSAALGHPRHGYYMTADRFGAAGDFITAPEISQMFGELVGLWCADTWDRLGRPQAVTLVELGPGRGTLMADALRAVDGVLPAFTAAVRLHLVETSPVLRRRQGEMLARWRPTWHDRLSDVPEGSEGSETSPLLVVANEFFDALPVRQFQRGARGWAERLVGLDEAETGLCFRLGATDGPSTRLIPPRLRAASPELVPPGTVIDLGLTGQAVAGELGQRLARTPGAALIIDYGHTAPVPTDTLQALRRHAPAPVLADPGDADLTTHVDFGALAEAATAAGARAHGPVSQGAWLQALGITTRAAMLRRNATTAQAQDINAALHRLTADDAMGTLFKVLALTAPNQPPPAGFG